MPGCPAAVALPQVATAGSCPRRRSSRRWFVKLFGVVRLGFWARIEKEKKRSVGRYLRGLRFPFLGPIDQSLPAWWGSLILDGAVWNMVGGDGTKGRRASSHRVPPCTAVFLVLKRRVSLPFSSSCGRRPLCVCNYCVVWTSSRHAIPTTSTHAIPAARSGRQLTLGHGRSKKKASSFSGHVLTSHCDPRAEGSANLPKRVRQFLSQL